MGAEPPDANDSCDVPLSEDNDGTEAACTDFVLCADCQTDSCLQCCFGCKQDEDCGSQGVCVDAHCLACDPIEQRGCTTTTPFCVGSFIPDPSTGASASELETTPWFADVAPQCVQCVVDADCKRVIAPVCDRGECVECLSDTDCSAERPVCEPTTRRCSECLRDDHCDGERARCDLDSLSCVECVEDAHCPDDQKTHCDPDRQQCFTCARDEHCNGLTCDIELGVCVGCTDDADCAGITGTEACDVATNRCVECHADNSDACNGTVCVTVPSDDRYTCSDALPESTHGCAPCVASAQCVTGQRCVTDGFGAQTIDDRYYCLPEASPNDENETRFCAGVIGLASAYRTTAEGDAGWYCSIREVTCAARHAAVEAQPCREHDDCGVPDLDDGFCYASQCSYSAAHGCIVPVFSHPHGDDYYCVLLPPEAD